MCTHDIANWRGQVAGLISNIDRLSAKTGNTVRLDTRQTGTWLNAILQIALLLLVHHLVVHSVQQLRISLVDIVQEVWVVSHQKLSSKSCLFSKEGVEKAGSILEVEQHQDSHASQVRGTLDSHIELGVFFLSFFFGKFSLFSFEPDEFVRMGLTMHFLFIASFPECKRVRILVDLNKLPD